MKNIYLISIFTFLCSCTSHNKENTLSYRIIGTSKKEIKDSYVYLKSQLNNGIITIDSVLVKNNSFEFTGSLEKPEIFGIQIEGTKQMLPLFMENTTINVTLNPNDLSQSKITGSKLQDEYQTFIKNSNKIISKMNVYFLEFQKARSENDVEKLEELNEKMRSINAENTLFILTYSKEHPQSYVSAVALNSILSVPSVSKDTIKAIYENFSPYVKRGAYAQEIALYLKLPDSIKLN